MKMIFVVTFLLVGYSSHAQSNSIPDYFKQWVEENKAMVPGGTEVRLPLNRWFRHGAEQSFDGRSVCHLMTGEDPERGKFISGSYVLIRWEQGRPFEGLGPVRPLTRFFLGLDPETYGALMPINSGWVRARKYGPTGTAGKYWLDIYDYLVTKDLSTIVAFIMRTYIIDQNLLPSNAASEPPAGIEPSTIIECGGGSV